MTDRVVLDPAALDRRARATADAVADLRVAMARLDHAMDAIGGNARDWTTHWVGFDGVDEECRELDRMGEFVAWLAGRARDLDRDHLGLVHTTTRALGPLGSARLLDRSDRLARGAEVGARLLGWFDGGVVRDADWALLTVLATDPAFARGLLASLGGPDGTGATGVVGLVDLVMAQRARLSDRSPLGTAPDGPGGPRDDGGMTVLTRALGSVLGAATRRPDWTAADTDVLVDTLRLGPGDDGFVAGRAAGLAVLLAAADDVAPGVVARVVDTAVAIDRAEGGQRAWDRRAATAGDTPPWPQPLVDHAGEPAHDVLAVLLATTARDPGVALALLSTGATVRGPERSLGEVDATLAHLVGRDFEAVGWQRLGATLEAAVLPHRGRDRRGTAAARVTAQAVPLLAARWRREDRLPAPLRRPVASLLVDAMPSAMFALDGVRPRDWVATGDDGWTFRDVPSLPRNQPVQPGLVGGDVRDLVRGLADDPDQVDRLVASAVASLDLAVARTDQQHPGDLVALRTAVATPSFAAGALLATAVDEVADGDQREAAVRDRVASVGGVAGMYAPMALVGGAVQQLARHWPGAHDDADEADYDGGESDLDAVVHRRLRDAMVVHGWFTDVPEAALRRDDHGVVVGLDDTSGALADWTVDPGDGHDQAVLDTISDQVARGLAHPTP